MEKPLRIIIVEDSEDDSFLLLRTLRRGGYAPDHRLVDNADSLINALAEQSWDIVISDYSLPGFNGLAALELLKQSGQDIPFIIVSGVIGEETAVEAMRAGAHDYLMKGNLGRLIPAIERELREAEQRRAHRAFEDEIRKLSSALAQSASLVMITDLSGIVEYTNSAFQKLTGYSMNESISKRWDFLEFVLENDANPTDLKTSVAMQQEWRGELQITTKSKLQLWMLLTLTPVRDLNGEISQLLFVMEDVTERKQMEATLLRYNEQLEQMVEDRTQQLQKAKEQTEIILNTTSDAIALALPNGDIQQSNPAFNKIFSGDDTESVERMLWYLTDEDGIELLGKSFLSVIYDQCDERVEIDIRTLDENDIDADVVLVPVSYADGDRAGFVLSLRDISHLKEVERFKTRFVANATHDLSHPIAVMKTRLYLLERTPHRLNEHVQILSGQIERLEHLVTELRTLSELDQGKLELHLGQLEINTLIHEVVQNHQQLVTEKQQTLIFEPASNLPQLSVDVRKVERVIVNLIANALSYTPVGGEIRVKTTHSADSIFFFVQDTGIGIPSEDVPHIFERFYRSSNAQERDSQGTGLGLAITKEMVELHGGSIHVDSVINQGTTFTVELPLR